MTFAGLDEACKALLLSTAGILNQTRLRYAIAGGWVPLLLEPNHPDLKHPGTRDVDVLMIDRIEEVKTAVLALLNHKFRPSAKHEFQLLRDASVGGRDFVFNVDLMHPSEVDSTPQMFHDIFDLGVNDAYDPRGSRFAKSIAFRSVSIVYEQNLFLYESVSGLNLDHQMTSQKVPILNAPAFILSKCESVSVAKRTRDAFDIYYLLSGVGGTKAADDLLSLTQKFDQVDRQVEKLRVFLMDSSGKFDANVSYHAGRPMSGSANKCSTLLTTTS